MSKVGSEFSFPLLVVFSGIKAPQVQALVCALSWSQEQPQTPIRSCLFNKLRKGKFKKWKQSQSPWKPKANFGGKWDKPASVPQLLGSNPDSISLPPPSTPLVTCPVLPSACSHATLNWGEEFSNWCSFDGIFSGSTSNVTGKLKRKMRRAAWSPLLSALSKLLVKKRYFLLCSLHTRDFLYLECLLWTGFLRWEKNSCHTHT